MILGGRRVSNKGTLLIEAMVYTLLLGVVLAVVAGAWYSLSTAAFAVGRHTVLSSEVERLHDLLVRDLARSEAVALRADDGQEEEGMLVVRMLGERARVWKPRPDGTGLTYVDRDGGKESKPVVVLRHGELSFDLIEREGKTVGVTVDVSLREPTGKGNYPLASFISFSAFVENAE